MTHSPTPTLLAAAAAALLLTACDQARAPGTQAPGTQAPGTEASGAAAPAAATTPAWRLAAAPADARPVGELTAAEAAQPVAVRGRIGGRADPVSPDSGLFLIVDPAVPSCADMPDDHCPTPWDYCCEPRDTLVANTATVLLVGADGSPLPLPPGRFAPLTEVVVEGELQPAAGGGTPVIHATGVHFPPNEPEPGPTPGA